jgi:hypothetical protein
VTENRALVSFHEQALTTENRALVSSMKKTAVINDAIDGSAQNAWLTGLMTGLTVVDRSSSEPG